ncbi:H+/Cl- antiporter ClcA [Mesonia maritima]|uniref:H+/Cl- antiporter ClcA n=1 Tax=Mesonia maritima TaxID=1793873 RepID=A0ABU1KAI0_9FLAO|nr:H+/Cl- antiporter ClcA [Mesonia maritima]
MAICGLLAGLVIHFIGDPGEIHLIVNNIRFNKGKLEPKNNPSMIFSSLLCVASGGSLGPEAPLVQVTGSTGSWLVKLLRLKGEELRSLSIAGMASGFTALFGAPLGGSLFSLEILHHKHAVEYYKAIIPAFVASCFSYLVFALIIHLGLGPIWDLSAYEYSGIFDFGYSVIFAVVGATFGWAFIFCTKFLNLYLRKDQFPFISKH